MSTIAPMLAKAVPTVPAPESVEGGLLYEPKWDGFRGVISYDGSGTSEGVEIGSRGSKPLTRYFPELTEALARILPGPCVLDGEIVVPIAVDGDAGRSKLDWEALSQRIHPAASRVEKLSVETPALFVAFDLLERGDESLLERPFAERRDALEQFAEGLPAPFHLSRTTGDVEQARRWLEEFEGAGLDGVVAKPLAAPYSPGKRVMLKVKHHRTADVVVTGYRIHASGQGVGSLLLGLFDGDGSGDLRSVGGASAFTDKRRLELVDELEPYVERDAEGRPVRGEGERSRFSGSKDVSFVKLRPELVVEVRYDQMEGMRFRHTVQFERWRPDREARSCTFEQLDRPIAYDLGDVLV
ncbi:ATP-dependent DNA ligase [Herbiconiux liangxiaofengii]|uniref:ATP-dependent DNA ligase n=1 Tax=Herbiconiux liangxiaofengii TaxID=3342795 RepID=UPI0035B9A8E7